MGKRSVKLNKNIYQLKREELGLTREKAGEQMQYISADRIEKIESEKSIPHPDEILTMAKCYKTPELANYYCSNECPIGMKYIPEVEMKDLSQIILEVLNSLNYLYEKRERLVEITVDGKITPDEYEDFSKIHAQLTAISSTINTMRFWLEKTIAEGQLDRSVLENKEK